MSVQIKTGKMFRAAFVNLAKPKMNKMSGKEEYTTTILIPKTDKEEIKRFRECIIAALDEKFGSRAKWPPKLRNIDPMTHISVGGDGWPIRDGDSQGYAGFEGHVSISVKSYDPVTVVDGFKQPITGEALKNVKSGMLCHAVVNCQGFDLTANKGASFWFGALQVCKDDGVRFAGGHVDTDKAFDVQDEDADNPEHYGKAESF